MDSSKYIEREPIEPTAGTVYGFSVDPKDYYSQAAFARHIGDPTKQRLEAHRFSPLGAPTRVSHTAAIQPEDLSDAELAEHLTAMRAQHSRELAEAKLRAAEANAEINAEAEALTKAIASALGLLSLHVHDEAAYDSAAGFVTRAVRDLAQAAEAHAADCAMQARKPVRAIVPASLSVCIDACSNEQKRRAQGKAAKLADLKSQLAALGVEV